MAVWNKAHILTLRLYSLTATFPREEVYGLTGQIRRAASSVPANIAEGCGRGGNAELSRYLRIALGSASELEYHLQLAHDLNYLGDEDHSSTTADVTEIKRMLTGLTRRLSTTSNSKTAD